MKLLYGVLCFFTAVATAIMGAACYLFSLPVHYLGATIAAGFLSVALGLRVRTLHRRYLASIIRGEVQFDFSKMTSNELRHVQKALKEDCENLGFLVRSVHKGRIVLEGTPETFNTCPDRRLLSRLKPILNGHLLEVPTLVEVQVSETPRQAEEEVTSEGEYTPEELEAQRECRALLEASKRAVHEEAHKTVDDESDVPEVSSEDSSGDEGLISSQCSHDSDEDEEDPYDSYDEDEEDEDEEDPYDSDEDEDAQVGYHPCERGVLSKLKEEPKKSYKGKNLSEKLENGGFKEHETVTTIEADEFRVKKSQICFSQGKFWVNRAAKVINVIGSNTIKIHRVGMSLYLEESLEGVRVLNSVSTKEFAQLHVR